jgi:hypothetical protein
MCGLSQRSRYSYSLRTGRSGDRFPVAATFSAPVQTFHRSVPAFLQWIAGLFLGSKAVSASSAEVKEKAELTSISALALHVMF